MKIIDPTFLHLYHGFHFFYLIFRYHENFYQTQLYFLSHFFHF
jgi:hypothetical protein